MKLNYFHRLQTLSGLAANELTALIIITFGLLLGFAVKFLGEDTAQIEKTKDFYHILDSLSELQKTTFVGSDNNGNPLPELVSGDTLIKKDYYFPENPKKQILNKEIDINTASKSELTGLSGIGPQIAERIIEYRSKKLFKKPEDLMNISGIGQKKFDKIKSLIKISKTNNSK